MSPEIYILTILLLPLTAVVVFAMKYASTYAAAKARLAGDNELKMLVSKNTEELSAVLSSLTLIADEQARQAKTLAHVDALLREVG